MGVTRSPLPSERTKQRCCVAAVTVDYTKQPAVNYEYAPTTSEGGGENRVTDALPPTQTRRGESVGDCGHLVQLTRHAMWR